MSSSCSSTSCLLLPLLFHPLLPPPPHPHLVFLYAFLHLIHRDADLLAVNSEGNMPYDICEDDETLDYIESEMAKRGITQEIIDETRAVTENQMLSDLKYLAETGQDLEYRDSSGATPVSGDVKYTQPQVGSFIFTHSIHPSYFIRGLC